MRRVLIDYAWRVSRRSAAAERARNRSTVTRSLVVQERAEELVLLDEALQRLHAVNEHHARIVECRFYGGMTVEETAEAFGVSPATIKRDWALARAWLNRELSE